MPEFVVRFEREYITTEGFERVFEAPSLAEAHAAAAKLCPEFDKDCPEDIAETDGRAESFYLINVGGTAFTGDPDYRVLPDGQCVPGEE